MRAVLDTNVLVSAALSRDGSPARILEAWLQGAFELVVSPKLLGEFERVLAYPKIRERIGPADAAELVELVTRSARHHDDPAESPPVRSRDPDDDYLIALAAATRSLLVSGDPDLLDLADLIPVVAPAVFLSKLGTS